MNCDDIRENLSPWLDGEFRSDDFQRHVDGCLSCTAIVAKYRRADELLGMAASRMVRGGASLDVAKIVRGGTRRKWATAILRAAAVCLVALAGFSVYVNTRSAPPLEVVLYARPDAVAGAPARLMFLVRNHQTGTAAAGARVVAHAGPVRGTDGRASNGAGGQTVEATSDAGGVVNISFNAPEEAGEFATSTEIVSDIGRETVEHKFAVRRPRKVLITTDKPLYQPSQTVHMRVLAMNTFTQRPVAGEELSLEIVDPRGNKIFRRGVKTSEFGSAAFDFALADEVNFGEYRIRASVGRVDSERTFEVKRYVLPKFKVELALDRTFYAPGQTLSGHVSAAYFFGQPVANGRVKVVGSSYVADRFEPVLTLTGRTDATGRFSFESILRTKFFGTELAGGDASLRVEAEVTDGADHSESKAVMTTVSRDVLKAWIIPEGGAIVPGVANRLFVITAYPDGRLAKTTLSFKGKEIESDGIATVESATSGRGLIVRARDTDGAVADAKMVDTGSRSFLVRPDRYRVRAGQPLGLLALASNPECTIYVDLVREGVTLVTKIIEVRGGKGELVLDLPAEAAGTLQLSAYLIHRTGEIERDTRTLIVEPPKGLSIELKSAKETYLPGEEMTVDISVKDGAGRPTVTELALAVVDESVFALHEARPGLEKVYFWIQEELLKPRYQLKGCPAFEAPAPAVMRDDALAQIRGSTVSVEADRPLQVAGFSIKDPKIRSYVRDVNQVLVMVAILLMVAGIVAGWWRLMRALARRTGFQGGASISGATGLLVLSFGLALAVFLPGTMLMQRASGKRGIAMPGEDVMGPGVGAAGKQSPRIRERFPETLYWNAAVLTDEDGHARVVIPGADSITTWRMTASAVSKSGGLGAADSGLKVFQDFFIDLDLPVALTQGDIISIPVACYNYLKTPQDVTLRLTTDGGLEIRDEMEKVVTLAPGEVKAVYFKVRAGEFGKHLLTVIGRSATAEDGVRREVEILPDGKETPFAVSDSGTGRRTLKVNVPMESISGAGSMWVRLYPSSFSEVVTGLESLVQMPYG